MPVGTLLMASRPDVLVRWIQSADKRDSAYAYTFVESAGVQTAGNCRDLA